MNMNTAAETAKRYLIDGVNSPIRTGASGDGEMLFIQSGSGSKVTALDGTVYVDYVLAYGPLLLGHAHPAVVDAVSQQATLGTVFGTCSVLEAEFAKRIHSVYPTMETMRFVNSGAEATLNAMRLARGITGRSKIIQFRGCYHGHVTPGADTDILLCDYNDRASVQAFIESESVAGIIVEPVCGNMGVIAPEPGFLAALRALTQASGSLLIFDEVMTGFRSALGGAQSLYSIQPDITCLAKVVGGGLPCAVVGGRTEYMHYFAPKGPVYQAGTFNGNPLCMAAGIAAIDTIVQTQASARAAETATQLASELRACSARYATPVSVAQVGSMLSVFFSDECPKSFADVQRSQTALFPQYYAAMKAAGVLIPPSPYEAYFVSSVHDESDVAAMVRGLDQFLATQ
jgi:glutamate-1-semialdehyde 2,1-aminomutase